MSVGAWIGIVVLLMIAAGIIAVCMSNMTLRLVMSHISQNDQLTVDIHALYGLLRRRYTIPMIKFKGFMKGFVMHAEKVNRNQGVVLEQTDEMITIDKVKEYYSNFKNLIEHFVGFNEWVSRTLQRIKFTKLNWTTYIGFGDAAETAIATGLAWSLKTSLLGYIAQYIRLKVVPSLAVHPSYNQPQLSTEIVGEAKIRMGYVIVGACMFLVRIVRAKGGFRTWQRALFKV